MISQKGGKTVHVDGIDSGRLEAAALQRAVGGGLSAELTFGQKRWEEWGGGHADTLVGSTPGCRKEEWDWLSEAQTEGWWGQGDGEGWEGGSRWGWRSGQEPDMPASVAHGKEFGFYSKGNGSHQRFDMDKAISPIYILMSRGLAAVGRLD